VDTSFLVDMNKELIHLKVNGAYFKINSNETNGLTWTTTNSETSNDVTTWSTKLCESSEAKNHLKLLDALKHQSHLKLEIAIKNAGMSYEILMEKTQGNEDVFEFKSKFEMRNFGRDDSQLIEKHLANLIELSEMEANASKWCLLTLVELMCIINFDKYKAVIFRHLDELTHVDLFRKNFHIDLKQKIISNNVIF